MLRVTNAVMGQVQPLARQLQQPVSRHMSHEGQKTTPLVNDKTLNRLGALGFGLSITALIIVTEPKTDEERAAQKEALKQAPGSY